MRSVEIIEWATEDGVQLALSPSGNISAKGDQSTIDSWLLAIRQSKVTIIAELQLDGRRAKVAAMLRDTPCIQVIDPNYDPVIVVIGIRNIATFEMNIPQVCYDVFALPELIKKHTGNEHEDAWNDTAAVVCVVTNSDALNARNAALLNELWFMASFIKNNIANLPDDLDKSLGNKGNVWMGELILVEQQ